MIAKSVLVLLALSATGFGQNPMLDDMKVFNGRFWRSMPHTEKVMYLIGVEHGIKLGIMKSAANGKCAEALGLVEGSGATIDDYEKEFDKLYGEGENLQINTMMAWTYLDMKLRGNHTKDYLENKLIELRQLAAKHVQH